MKDKINTKKSIIVIFTIAIITIVLTGVLYKTYTNEGIVDYNEIPMHIKVTNTTTIGFNTQTDALYFGTVPRGYGSAVRKFDVKNNFDHIVNVEIYATGSELAQWISINNNYTFTLLPKEDKRIEITATVPNNTNIGNYSAELIIKMFKIKE